MKSTQRNVFLKTGHALILVIVVNLSACSSQVKNHSQNSEKEIRPISAIEKRFHDRF